MLYQESIFDTAIEITVDPDKLGYHRECDKSCCKTLRHNKNHLFFWHSFRMSISSPTPANDTSVWTSLKQAIAASSGFQHWASQLPTLEQSDLNLYARVQRYLRETLETLAY